MVLRSVFCRRIPALVRRECSTFGHWDTAQFKPKKAVILTKVSRYEFEKLRHDNLSESQLEQELTARGSNYAAIRHHHNIHKVLYSSQSLSRHTFDLLVSRGGRGRYSGEGWG